MDPHAFDQLVRGFGQSATRRRAVGSLLGGALAALAAPGAATRRPHRHDQKDTAKAGDRDCAHFCTTLLPPGPERGRCISDAARNNPTGLCAQCGGNVDAVCCVRSADGTCDPTHALVCCASGQTCLRNGTCVLSCPNGGPDCPSGCDGCARVAGGKLCITTVFGDGCDRSDPASCPQGQVCVGQVDGVCLRACPA